MVGGIQLGRRVGERFFGQVGQVVGGWVAHMHPDMSRGEGDECRLWTNVVCHCDATGDQHFADGTEDQHFAIKGSKVPVPLCLIAG